MPNGNNLFLISAEVGGGRGYQTTQKQIRIR